MRPRHLAVAFAVVVATGAGLLPAPAGASSDADIVDRYTQVVYELENPAGTRMMNAEETVVDATGEGAHHVQYTEGGGRSEGDRADAGRSLRLPQRP